MSDLVQEEELEREEDELLNPQQEQEQEQEQQEPAALNAQFQANHEGGEQEQQQEQEEEEANAPDLQECHQANDQYAALREAVDAAYDGKSKHIRKGLINALGGFQGNALSQDFADSVERLRDVIKDTKRVKSKGAISLGKSYKSIAKHGTRYAAGSQDLKYARGDLGDISKGIGKMAAGRMGLLLHGGKHMIKRTMKQARKKDTRMRAKISETMRESGMKDALDQCKASENALRELLKAGGGREIQLPERIGGILENAVKKYMSRDLENLPAAM